MIPYRSTQCVPQQCCRPVARCTHGVPRQRRSVVVRGLAPEPSAAEQPFSPQEERLLSRMGDIVDNRVRVAVQQSMQGLHEELGLVKKDTGVLMTKLERVEADVGILKTDVGLCREEVKEAFEQINTNLGRVWDVATIWGLERDLGRVLGEGRSLRSAKDVLSVMTPDGTQLTVDQLVSVIREDGFWSLLRAGVTFVQNGAQGKGRRRRSSPEEEAAAVAKAAADLRRMNADGVITAGMAGERPLEAAMEVIDALHRSGVGSKFHATHLEEYVKFPEKCAGLCAGCLFVPFLSAAATGWPLDVLQLDRCGGMKLETQLSRASSALHIGELKLKPSLEAVRKARQQLARAATILAWIYHALRLRGGQHLPDVLDVWGYVIIGQDGKLPTTLPQLSRVESLPMLGCPLTVYYTYYEVSGEGVKQWGHTE